MRSPYPFSPPVLHRPVIPKAARQPFSRVGVLAHDPLAGQSSAAHAWRAVQHRERVRWARVERVGVTLAQSQVAESVVLEGDLVLILLSRLRPLLMTTVCTLAAAVTRAARGAELQRPLALAVIGGLVVSTLVTLLIVPVLVEVFGDLEHRRRSRAISSGA